MLNIEGKYGKATIMLDSWEDVEESVVSQLYSMLNHPKFNSEEIVIMPDTHSGKGSVIGFTMPLNGAIVPNVVGVDIACGMFVVQLPDDISINFEKLDDFIHNNIPAGYNIHDRQVRFLKDYLGFNYDLFSYSIHELSDRVGQSVKPMESIGSIGGGNHFCEIDYSDKYKCHYLVIHSGSRNLGARVCAYHQDIAVRECQTESGILCSKELAYLINPLQYLVDVDICTKYACINREIMAASIMRDFFGIKGWNYRSKSGILGNTFHCLHNYISESDVNHPSIVRKGAISSKLHEQVIIPLNMRDGCILGVGKENKAWNYSAPHGAGRIYSRSQAKKLISMDDFRDSMNGIYTTSVNEGTIDESPMAYKDPELIKRMIGETVEITDIIKPVYNFKAPEQKRKKKGSTDEDKGNT